MICDEFSSRIPRNFVPAARNPLFIWERELLTYDVMKVDAPAIGMLGQDKPFICVSVKGVNYHGPP